MNAPAHRRRAAPLLAAALVGTLLVGCTPSTSDGGRIVVTEDDRIDEVRAARAALGEVVPAVTAEAERLGDAVEALWTSAPTSAARSEQVEALRLEPFRTALDDLEAVEVAGDGPDVDRARAAVAAMVTGGRGLLAGVEEELASLAAAGAFDAELEELLAGWDARGSYSEQLAAFEEMASAAAGLAEQASGATAVPPCTGLWERRQTAATAVAERTEELRALIQDRRGQEFDELRDAYGQDPYGLGALLVELDAAAAEDCWAGASAVTEGLDRLAEHTEELETALDPEDLRA